MAINSSTEVFNRAVNQMAETAIIATGVETQFIPTSIPNGTHEYQTPNITHRSKFHTQRVSDTASTEPTIIAENPVDVKTTIKRKTFPGNYIPLHPYDSDLLAYDDKALYIQEKVQTGALLALRYQRLQLSPDITTEGESRIFFTDTGTTHNLDQVQLFQHATTTTAVKVGTVRRVDIHNVMQKIWSDYGEQEGLPVMALVPPQMWADLVNIYSKIANARVNEGLLVNGILRTMDGVTFYRTAHPVCYELAARHGVDPAVKVDLGRLLDSTSGNVTAIYDTKNTIGALFLVHGQGHFVRSELHGQVYDAPVDPTTLNSTFNYAPSISVGKTRTNGEGCYSLLYKTVA